jgi:hypothetical protein
MDDVQFRRRRGVRRSPQAWSRPTGSWWHWWLRWRAGRHRQHQRQIGGTTATALAGR